MQKYFPPCLLLTIPIDAQLLLFSAKHHQQQSRGYKMEPFNTLITRRYISCLGCRRRHANAFKVFNLWLLVARVCLFYHFGTPLACHSLQKAKDIRLIYVKSKIFFLIQQVFLENRLTLLFFPFYFTGHCLCFLTMTNFHPCESERCVQLLQGWCTDSYLHVTPDHAVISVT